MGTSGDGLLVEFPSVVEAVNYAVEMQTVMANRNADIPDDEKMLFRIGINLGDVLVDGDDIYGDGVNIAARLEALAKPGGICVSAMVHDGVRDRLDVAFEDMGEIEVKNIARPVRTFRVVLDQTKDAARPVRAIGATPSICSLLPGSGATSSSRPTASWLRVKQLIKEQTSLPLDVCCMNC